MNGKDVVITVASWEDRFVLGLRRLLIEKEPRMVLMFYYAEYADRTKTNRNKIRSSCEEKGIAILDQMISFKNPTDNWRILDGETSQVISASDSVIVDVSTMPRDTIWSTFYFLDEIGANTFYVYNRPERYSNEWLSRDPGVPRLVYKLSGISEFGKATALIIITGFDPERTEQLITYYEPKVTYLGLQTGDQYENKRMNVKKHMDTAKSYTEINVFDIDAYSDDHGYSIISQIITEHLTDYNIIIASLGPKPSAIALYRLHKTFPHVALAYAPSNDFNLEYSLGICGDGEIHKL